MIPKKLCSIGILDIELNLILYKSQTEKYNFDINNYNKVQDLKNIFYNNDNNENKIDYFKYTFLSSENNLINTLLFINRAYKTKTFIEFIVPNKLEFNDKNKFLKNFIDEILSKNYLFIIETSQANNSFSKINFVIKIVDDLLDTIKFTKKFEIISNNNNSSNDTIYNLIEREEIEKLFLRQFNYNFNKIDFFIIDLKEIRKILSSNAFF